MKVRERVEKGCYEEARRLYLSGDFYASKKFLDEIVEADPLSPEGQGALFLRARGYEDGRFSAGVSLLDALTDYRAVGRASDIGGEARLGCARVMLAHNGCEEFQEISRLCEEIMGTGSGVKAMMLMGLAIETCKGNMVEARRWYLRAFLNGMPWGMRYVAYAHARQKHYVRAALAHIVAGLASPFLVARYGIRAPFH